MAGREPMNPHPGQYRLGGSAKAWVRIEEPTAAEARAIRRAYKGLTPSVYGRYGVRQLAAPMPWTRLVVKDPFAVLSLGAVTRVTGARVVLVHRHPAAMLDSYRRMGWLPDIDELKPIVERFRARCGPEDMLPDELETNVRPESAAALGWFWSSLYSIALADVRRVKGVLVVSHERIASDSGACRILHEALGVTWSAATDAEFNRTPSGSTDTQRLHNLDRSPAQTAVAWRDRLDPAEFQELDEMTTRVQSRLHALELGARLDGV